MAFRRTVYACAMEISTFYTPFNNQSKTNDVMFEALIRKLLLLQDLSPLEVGSFEVKTLFNVSIYEWKNSYLLIN